MGNAQGRESRDPHGRRLSLAAADRQLSTGTSSQNVADSRRGRHGRGDPLIMLGLLNPPNEEQPFTHKETRAEREARKREEKRVLREMERKRSMRSERVDGGFLVTLGTYVGPEDFNKAVVRQLIIERKMAPFWRGLNDMEPSWTDAQLVAVVRGQPLPAADAQLPVDLISPGSVTPDNMDINALTVPLARTQSAASEQKPGSSSSGGLSSLRPGSSHFRSRKSIAAAMGFSSSRNSSQVEISTPPETHLPVDAFVNGQPLEVHLYRNPIECPICFLSYPAFLNHTRCCDQPICSECFVQIKRPDPHFPEHHGEGDAPRDEDQPPEMLVSEPATCPYCQQPEFGITYEPPPFRCGIVYDTPASMTAGMSSHISVNSSGSPLPAGRRRTESLSASSPLVVSTDRVRPDWAIRLATQRNHLARRAAAATALHNAAFLVSGSDERRGLFGRGSRRNQAAGEGPHGVASPSLDPPVSGTIGSFSVVHATDGGGSGSQRGASSRDRNINDLESMMMAEAMRLSLLSEEDRRNKAAREAQKAAAKEAKRLEKEERKQEKEKKQEKKKKRSSFYGLGFSHYGSSSYHDVATAGTGTGSSTSLGGTKRRGDNNNNNNNNNNPRVEITPATIPEARAPIEQAVASRSNDKGKDVARGPVQNSGLTGTQSGSSAASSIPDSYIAVPDAHTSNTSVEHDGDDDDLGSAGNEPMFNFRSLAEIVGVDIESGTRPQSASKNSQRGIAEHAEHAEELAEEDKTVKVPVSTANEVHPPAPALS